MKDVTLGDLQCFADQDLILNMLIKWQAASNNPELTEVSSAFTRVFVHKANMDLEAHSYQRILSQSRNLKNTAVLRARKAETALEAAEKKIIDLEAKLKIFGI